MGVGGFGLRGQEWPEAIPDPLQREVLLQLQQWVQSLLHCMQPFWAVRLFRLQLAASHVPSVVFSDAQKNELKAEMRESLIQVLDDTKEDMPTVNR